MDLESEINFKQKQNNKINNNKINKSFITSITARS